MADKFDEVTEEMRSLLNGEEIVEADPENKYRKRRVVLGVLTGILVLLLAGFCFFTMVYMPNKAFQGLDEIESMASEDIDRVTEDALGAIERYRKQSILHPEDAQRFDNRFQDLQKIVERWQKIKAVMKSEDYYLADGSDAEVLLDPLAPNKVTTASPNKDVFAPNDDPGPGPNANNGMGAQYSKYDYPSNSNHPGKKRVRYCAQKLYGHTLFLRAECNHGDIHPTDFPIYEEYQEYTKAYETAIGKSVNIISRDEYRELMREQREIESGYKAYRDALDELKDINATQKTAEDMTDESEYPQGVMVDSNEAEASKPSKLLPLATTIDGRPISTAPAGPWEGPKDK